MMWLAGIAAFVAGIGFAALWRSMIAPLLVNSIGKFLYTLTFGFMGRR